MPENTPWPIKVFTFCVEHIEFACDEMCCMNKMKQMTKYTILQWYIFHRFTQLHYSTVHLKLKDNEDTKMPLCNCLHTVHITEVGKLFEIHFLWAISPLLDNTVKSDGKAGKRARGKTCSKGPGLELTPLWQMDARSACKRNQTGSNFIIMTHY